MSNNETNDVEAIVARAVGRVAGADNWLTPKEAASCARLSLDNFLRRCRNGRGPAFSGKGRLMRFRTSDVDAWVEGGCSHEA